MKTEGTPRLAKPGAGLPFFQSLLLRYYYGPFVAAKTDWSVSKTRFNKLHTIILKSVEGLSTAQLETRVLVPPQQGLEDSSRYWSVKMTLEHIMIVGRGIQKIINDLTNGRTPDYTIEIAMVKPSGEKSTEEVLKEFRIYCAQILPELESSMKNRDSNLKLLHPWFGPINAKQWYWLLAVHAGIHLKQIKAILAGMN